MGWIIFILIVAFVVVVIVVSTKKKKKRSMFVKQKLSNIENFTISKKVNGFDDFYIFAIDETNEKIAFVTEKYQHVVSFGDIIGVELIENGNTVTKKSTNRTIGGAIIGGVLGGGAGAIIGGLSGNSKETTKISTVSVKLLLRNLENPSLFIHCFDAKTMMADKKPIHTEGKMESTIYRSVKQTAEEIRDIVSVIIDRVDSRMPTA